MTTWMVRAGRGGRFFEMFRDQGVVAVGWDRLGDVGRFATRGALLDAVKQAYPEKSEGSALITASQLFRFAREMRPGERVVTYDPRARVYLCGEIAGAFSYHADAADEELLSQRAVVWQHEIARDRLSPAARASLGSLATIFAISSDVATELWCRSDVAKPAVPEDEALLQAAEPDVEILANEAIKDRVAALEWDQMQELVAGLLRAMGYKTQVSPPGSDRGKDIIASPDGFGFQEPRIVVEVKHRKATRMGAQEIRSFLGGRHPRDKGLFVSTGGFSKDAYYEAERASIPMTLMDFESLVEAIQEHYGDFDEQTRALLPLKRVYWPIKD